MKNPDMGLEQAGASVRFSFPSYTGETRNEAGAP